MPFSHVAIAIDAPLAITGTGEATIENARHELERGLETLERRALAMLTDPHAD